jgi:HNH endonuclease
MESPLGGLLGRGGQKRRTRKKGNGGSFTATEWRTLKRQYGYYCVGCWKTETELKALGRMLVPDHIVAVDAGGLNDITNIQPLCHGTGGCNNRKGNKYLDFVI